MAIGQFLRAKKTAAWINLFCGLAWLGLAARDLNRHEGGDAMLKGVVAALFLFGAGAAFYRLRRGDSPPTS